MSFVKTTAVIALAAAALAGCGSPYGGPAPIADFQRKSLDLAYDISGGLVATLNYSFSPADRCELLDDDAVALLNGRPVPLFKGDIQVTPPMGDDGSFDCVPPSVTVNPIPADLPPPWTIEIGDSSEVVSATFDLTPVTPATIGPVATPVLTSWQDSLIIEMQNGPGITPPIGATDYIMAFNGFGTRAGSAQITPTSLVFPQALDSQSEPGPITVQVVANFFSDAELLDCQAPTCTMAPRSGIPASTSTNEFTITYAPGQATN
jgi:hypothetical protein